MPPAVDEGVGGVVFPNVKPRTGQQNESGDTASDSTSSHSPEMSRANVASGFFARLKNMTLEEIASNPSLLDRRKVASSPQSPTNGTLQVDGLSSGALKAQ